MNKHNPLPPRAGLLEAMATALAQQKSGLRDLVHDLRSPLTALQLGTETLLENSGGGFEQMMLEQMLSDVGRLAQMLASARAPGVGALEALLAHDLESAAAAARSRGVSVEMETQVLRANAAAITVPGAICVAQSAWAAAATARDGSRIAFRLLRDGGGLLWELSITCPRGAADGLPAIDSLLAADGDWTGTEESGPLVPGACRRYRLRLTQGPDASKPA
ncbi:histidine kinase dimerization/phospho-acceptor domain-containing protein [Mangrovicoccus sp. HB161399]|uniref:histidine kinase dimerization/phospho-acceptor domain-containing protein n=1 Tax=Mangrovicoccus sp. HB161399 TaxID=2720392 RepID=UPI0015538D03|nr:histidine kinase dimerization/phospho-acceptor domain-containing protein [Mangrovicoccus sp. HB161399]